MTISADHDAGVTPDSYYTIGELLERYRQRRRLTQKELADELGVAERTARNWLKGERAPRGRAVHDALERVLGVRLIEVGDGRYRTAPGEVSAPNLEGVDVVETTTDEGHFVISFPKGLLDGLTPLEREVRIARARVAALEAMREANQPERSDAGE